MKLQTLFQYAEYFMENYAIQTPYGVGRLVGIPILIDGSGLAAKGAVLKVEIGGEFYDPGASECQPILKKLEDMTCSDKESLLASMGYDEVSKGEDGIYYSKCGAEIQVFTGSVQVERRASILHYSVIELKGRLCKLGYAVGDIEFIHAKTLDSERV